MKILLFCSSFENFFAISQAVRYPGNVFIYLFLLEAGEKKICYCNHVGKPLVILFVQARFQKARIIVHHETALIFSLACSFPVVIATITGCLVSASLKKRNQMPEMRCNLQILSPLLPSPEPRAWILLQLHILKALSSGCYQAGICVVPWNHRMLRVGRDLQRSSSPTPLH